jgi:hypothetical protein
MISTSHTICNIKTPDPSNNSTSVGVNNINDVLIELLMSDVDNEDFAAFE